MKNTVLIIVLSATLSSTCLFDRGSSIAVFNKSNETIYIGSHCEETLEQKQALWLHHIENRNGIIDTIYPHYRALPDSIGYVIFRGHHEEVLKQCPDKKLRFFIIKESTLKEHTWKEICHEKLYDKLVVTEDELIKNDWKIIYE